MCSTAPGGYSTVSINISLPGMSSRSFCMMGTTIGCGAVCAGAGGVSSAVPARTSAAPRIRRYNMADPVVIGRKRIPGSGRRLRAAEPFVETNAPEARLAQRHQRTLIDSAAVVSSLGIAHDPTRVADGLQIAGNEFVERRSFRAGDLYDAVERRRERHIRNIDRNVLRRDGLEQAGRDPNRVSIHT